MNKDKLQKRSLFQQTRLHLREEKENDTIEGVAIVANVETVLYEGSTYREIEVIDPSAISADFIATQDIKINLLHEREYTFGRNNKGKGSLVLNPRETQLEFSHPVDSDIAKQARDLIKNGTYSGCSFEFWPKDYEVTEREAADGKKEYVIRHKAFERVSAITIGMDPAYKDTSVSLRELYREKCKKEDEDETEKPKGNDGETPENPEAGEDGKDKCKECDKKKARERELRDMQSDFDALYLPDYL